jgi:hypothetical protein
MRQAFAWTGALTILTAASCLVPIEDVASSSGGSSGSSVGGSFASGGSSASGGTQTSGGSGGSAPDSSSGGQAATEGGTQGGSGGLITPESGSGGTISSGGTDGAAPVTYDCKACKCAELGRFATWCGKVNIHKDINFGWTNDATCSAGCTVNTIDYCTKLWSGTVEMLEVKPEGLKYFSEAGCLNQWPFEGEHEYLCLGCIEA